MWPGGTCGAYAWWNGVLRLCIEGGELGPVKPPPEEWASRAQYDGDSGGRSAVQEGAREGIEWTVWGVPGRIDDACTGCSCQGHGIRWFQAA